MTVAALFVRRTSHYKKMAGVDCYDADRDALTFKGGCPGVYHPPCRAWGKLSHFAKPRQNERELALWSVDMVRLFGGVIEHPKTSRLWQSVGCAGYGIRDQFDGVLFPVLQSWWGHRAPKETCLYLVGAPVPALPGDIPHSSHVVERMCTAERERTPEPFARFLVDLAHSVEVRS